MAEVTNLYSELQQMLKEDFEIPEEVINTEEDEGYSEVDYFKHKVSKYIKANYKMILIGVGYGITLLHLIYQVICLLLAMFLVDPGFLMNNPIYIAVWLLYPFIIWMFSTLYDYWNFHNRKMGWLTIGVINLGIIIAQMLYQLYCALLLPLFVKFPTSPDISMSMIFNLIRILFAIFTIVPIAAFLNSLITNMYSTITRRAIIKFKLCRNIDLRKDANFCYDMQVVDDLVTGKHYTIKEKDRTLHSLANGTTGTGKTSSLFTVAIAHDMDKIVHNVTYQKKEVEALLKKGLIRMKTNFSDSYFSLDNFEVVKGDKEALYKLKFKAPIAGISAMAPNASFSDEIYDLAKQKGLKVNRLDPTLTPGGKLKEGFVGFNPLYINPNLTRLEWMMEVSRKAVLFADVTQAVYDANGQSDVYFASLNKNITTGVTMLVLLTYPDLNNGKQPSPAAIQDILNDFKKAKKYRDMLIRKFGKKNEAGHPIMDAGTADVGPFQSVLDIVDSEILGQGSEKIFDQSRGLRVIINSFMTNPLIKNILCSENTIDLDNALANGELTVVNYALELGSDSTAFGLFFLLSFINAVFRRPGKESTRLPHFFYVDELS